MKTLSILPGFFAFSLALSTQTFAAEPAAQGHAQHAGMGLKKELIEGITPGDFLKLGSKPKSVAIIMAAAFTEANYGMNFNGYSHGKATYTIPAGWSVDVTFINPSPVPHSLIVVEKEMVKKMQLGEPAFAGASTPSPITGMSTGKASFSFTAGEPGDYVFACGFPTHAAGGHWVGLEVSATATEPTLTLGDGQVLKAK
jgi:sulfocyanin